jgi:ferredoxin-like protein FixX
MKYHKNPQYISTICFVKLFTSIAKDKMMDIRQSQCASCLITVILHSLYSDTYHFINYHMGLALRCSA